MSRHSTHRSDAPQVADLRQRLGPKVAVVVVAALVLASVGTTAAMFALWPRSDGTNRPKAVIVDQLAITDPNPNFVADATRELETAGYQVDYVPPDAVTVDYYRALPKQGYELVILRSHSSFERISRPTGGGTTPSGTVSDLSVALFTNEPYSTRHHIYEQRQGQLLINSYPERNIEQAYFGVTPEFITYAAEGRFPGSIVILMGCGGLTSDSMAEAFMEKGATAFVSWDGSVTAAHTDDATDKLLELLIGRSLGAADAVAQTMVDVGPDPAFGAHLVAYP